MLKYWKLSEYKNLEIQLDRLTENSICFGLLTNISSRMIFINLGLFLFKFDLRWSWRGDHRGCNIAFEFLTGHFIDIIYYDSRHED